jgi:hypothetical protein
MIIIFFSRQTGLTGVLVLFGEELGDLISSFTLRKLDIILGVASIVHEREKAVFGDVKLSFLVSLSMAQQSDQSSYQLIFLSGDIWDFHVVGRWRQILKLLAGEDIKGNKMNLCVTMLSRLGGGHVDNLARTSFDDNMPVLPQGRTLHWKSRRRTSIGAFESVLMLYERAVISKILVDGGWWTSVRKMTGQGGANRMI